MKRKLLQFVTLIFISSFSLTSIAQEDCQLVVDFGVEEETVWDYWSWASDDFLVVDNPEGDFPQAKVRKWQKGGGSSGVGATLLEGYIETEGYDSLGLWVYSETDSIVSLRVEVVYKVQDQEDQRTAYEYVKNLKIGEDEWAFVKFPLTNMFELVEFDSFNEFLIQANIDNDTDRWIKNFYYFGSMYLEKNEGCQIGTTNANNYSIINNDFFYFSNNSIKLMENRIETISVYSVTGNQVVAINNPQSNVSLNGLNPGLYVVIAQDFNKQAQISKVIVR